MKGFFFFFFFLEFVGKVAGVWPESGCQRRRTATGGVWQQLVVAVNYLGLTLKPYKIG
jgi:hypothetical protein